MLFFPPTTNSFRDQAANETVKLVIRHHFIVLIGAGLAFLLLLSVPFIGYYFLQNTYFYLNFPQIYWFVSLFYFLLLWNVGFFRIMIYLLNNVIITDKRLIVNRQKGFFNYETNELPLDKIQDISVEMKGAFSAILDYGNIVIQTAGTVNKFYLQTIPHPQKIKDLLIS